MASLEKSAGAVSPLNSLICAANFDLRLGLSNFHFTPDELQVVKNKKYGQLVTVYHLRDEGERDHQGTGHVTVDSLQGTDEVRLSVVDKKDSKTLLSRPICPEDIYRKQGDTIISWRDPNDGYELALSFQDSAGCTLIWDQIVNAKRNLLSGTPYDETSNDGTELKLLPAVPSTSKVITESDNADQMRLIEHVLKDQHFFTKLMDDFKTAEGLRSNDALSMIYRILKATISFNSSPILEKILSDDLLMDDIIRCLEYEDVSEFHTSEIPRNILQDSTVLEENCQASPIDCSDMLSKMRQIYRIHTLGEIITRKVFRKDEKSGRAICHSINIIAVSFLKKDDNAFIQKLLAKIKLAITSAESKSAMLNFLGEICTLSLPVDHEKGLFRDLINEVIFDVVTTALQSEDKEVALKGADILQQFVGQDLNTICDYIIGQEGNQLLGHLVKNMITDFGEDVNIKFEHIIEQFLMFPTTQGDAFVDILYKKHLRQLVDLMESSPPSGGVTNPVILSTICEFLVACIHMRPHRIMYDFLRGGLIPKVLSLTQHEDACLKTSAVMFLDTILKLNDKQVMDYLVEENMMRPLVDAVIAYERIGEWR